MHAEDCQADTGGGPSVGHGHGHGSSPIACCKRVGWSQIPVNLPLVLVFCSNCWRRRPAPARLDRNALV